MLPHEKAQFELEYHLPRMQRKIEKALDLIRQAVEVPGRHYVAVSGGKDSQVVLDLLLQNFPYRWVMLNTDYWFGDDGWDYPETLEFLTTLERHYKIKISRARNEWARHDFAKVMGLPAPVEYNPAPPGGYDYVIPPAGEGVETLGYSLCFLGLRSEESKVRRLNFAVKKGGLYFAQGRGVWNCSPLHDWTYRDVWSYIAGCGLPYNPVYDKLAALGVELKHRRVGPLTVHNIWQYGAMTRLKRGWPDLFNRFAAAVPQARQHV